MDTRVFLIHLFKLLIEALSKNAVSQQTPSKVLAEVLEEAKADILERLEKYPFDCDLDIQATESIFSRHLKTFPIGYPSINRDRDIEVALNTFYQDFRIPELLSSFDVELDLGSLSHYNDNDNSATSTSLQKRRVVPPEEREPKKHGVEIAGLQASRIIRDCLQKVISSPVISNEEKIEIINEATFYLVDVFEARLKGITLEEALRRKVKTPQPKKGEIFRYQPKPEEVVQAPDLSEIPLWRGRKQDGMPLDFIKTHYGQYLSAFGAEQNNVFQDQIRAHDPKLMQGVSNQLHEEGKGRKVSEFVKPRSARTERELETFDLDTLKQAHRIKGLLRRRRLKGSDS